MDEQEKQAIIEQAKAEAMEAAKAEIEQTKTALTNTVEELKSERKKKQEIEAALDLLKAKNNPNPTGINIQEEIDKALQERDSKTVESIKADSLKKFKEAHPEFKPENDQGGIKYAAFEKKLARINLNGLTSESEFVEAYTDAYKLIVNTQTDDGNRNNAFASDPSHHSNPQGNKGTSLSREETDLIKSMNWTEERYLKVKKSRPTYVASLLKQSF